MVELRGMSAEDLTRVADWLNEPHVARWWLPETSVTAELEKMRGRIVEGRDPELELLTVLARAGDGDDPEAETGAGAGARARALARAGAPPGDGDGDGAPAEPIGWCQWYPWDADPAEVAAVGARPGDVGLDYAIGDPAAIGRGLGPRMVTALVGHVRARRPGCGLLVAPEAANLASRRTLERAGFTLIGVRPIATEPHERPMALYRLEGSRGQAVRRSIRRS